MDPAAALQAALADDRRRDLRLFDRAFRWADDLNRWAEMAAACAALGYATPVVPVRDEEWEAVAEAEARRFGYA